jgi:hypothetical protein
VRTLGVEHSVVGEDVVGAGVLLQVEVLHGAVADGLRGALQLIALWVGGV